MDQEDSKRLAQKIRTKTIVWSNSRQIPGGKTHDLTLSILFSIDEKMGTNIHDDYLEAINNA